MTQHRAMMSTRSSRNDRSSELAGAAQLAVLFASVLCASCNLLLRFDEPQCATHDDCNQRGLFDARCVAGLCQRQQAAEQIAREQPVTTSDASVAPNDAAPARDEQIASDAPAKRSAAESQTQAPNANDQAGAATMTKAPMLGTVSAGRGGRAASDQAGGSASTAQCPGAGCAECQVDKDCEQHGIAHGQCIGSVCFPAQSECSKDMDCLAKGAEFKGGRCLESQCVPNPLWRCDVPPPARETPARDISLPVLDGLSRSTLADIRVLVCPKLDLTCANPVAETQTDDKGIVHVTLPPNFNGYLLTEPRGYLPAMYFVPSHIPDDGVLDGFPMVGSGLSADALATSLGTTLDKQRGHMMLIQKDCMGNGVPGASFSSPSQDAKSVVFYVYDQLPTASSRVTSDTGQGGFLNLPAGTLIVEAKLRDEDVLLSMTSVVIRAGYISVAFIPPLPR